MRLRDYYFKIKSLDDYIIYNADAARKIEALPCNQTCPKCGCNTPNVKYIPKGSWEPMSPPDGLSLDKDMILLTCECEYEWCVPAADAVG